MLHYLSHAILNMSWQILLLVLVSSNAIKLCPPTQEDDLLYSPRQGGISIRHCMAQCLGLVEQKAGKTDCAYDATSGKSKGCGNTFFKGNLNKQVLLCEEGLSIDANPENLKACNMMYFNVFNLNTSSDVATLPSNINETLLKIGVFRNLGIKIIGHLYVYESAENFMRISEQAPLREKFSKSILRIVEELDLDGVYLAWFWPACPRGDNCKKGGIYKKQTVSMVTDIGKPIKEKNKLFMMFVSGSPFVSFILDDYYSDIISYIDYFPLETNNMASHSSSYADFNFNLKMAKEGVKMMIKKVKDPPLFAGKLLMSMSPYILSFELKDPKAGKIQVTHFPEPKKYPKFMTLNQWCKLIKPNSGYKVVRNLEVQNYAIKEDHLFVYDDVESMKAKVEWFRTFGGGINIRNSFADDMKGECGCGTTPYLKAVAELLKSKDCDPVLCF